MFQTRSQIFRDLREWFCEVATRFHVCALWRDDLYGHNIQSKLPRSLYLKYSKTCREATQKFLAAKFTRLTQQIVILWCVVVECCTNCRSWAYRWFREGFYTHSLNKSPTCFFQQITSRETFMGRVSLTMLHAAIVLLVWEVLGDTIHQFRMLKQCYIWSTELKSYFDTQVISELLFAICRKVLQILC